MNQLLAVLLFAGLTTGTIEERLEDRIRICEEVEADIAPEYIGAYWYMKGRLDSYRDCLEMIKKEDSNE
jgi:hypothetical protein